MHETLHLPDQLPFWIRVREHLKKAQAMVDKSSGVVPKWAAPVLLGAALTAASFIYLDVRGTQQQQLEAIRRLSDDILILKTQKEASDRQREKEEKEQREERDMNRLWRENIDKQMSRLALRLETP